ncbi:hypothetical protein K9L27_04135 [Candidatus Gracilibacteria bacterium]|nr:hypothetical protein [Candidatus Gracilibacteria bacterium]
MNKWTNWNFRSMGFYELLQDNEIIEKIYRSEFSSSFVKISFWGILYGGISFGLWFVFHGTNFFWAWIGMSLFTTYKILYVYLLWYMNAILMTTDNLVFVEWGGFFKTKSIRVDYWNLDEIQVVRVGLRSFLSNYGDLYFMKSGGGELYVAHKVNRPNRVARQIEAYRESQVDAKNFTEESALKNLLSSMVQSHVKEHGQPERPENKEQISKIREQRTESREKKESFRTKITNRFKPDEMPIEVEKELDDEGGIELDLEDK